jgi:hypothetical protein
VLYQFLDPSWILNRLVFVESISRPALGVFAKVVGTELRALS